MKLYTLDNQFIREIKYSYDNLQGVFVNFTGIIEFEYGTKQWYKDGGLHREDGPAIECHNDPRSEEDDCEYTDNEYWINGEYVSAPSIEGFKLLVDIMNLKGLL